MNIRTVLRGALGAVLLWCSASIHAEQYAIPLFVTASSGATSQGVLRLVSDADTAATVAIHAIDDTGARIGPATLTLNALVAVQLSATELQSGSAAKGLSAGLGSLSGEVRLSIDSDVPLVPSVYVRAADGTLSAMNATVLGAAAAGQAVGSERNAYRYDVAVFHPASNVTQPSRLRLINPGDAPARVTIAARDDTGAAATGGTVQLTLPAGGARTLSANQLEAGDSAAFTGRLGAGVGNWRLSVTSDRPLQAVNVTVGLSGEWRNLSSTGISGWAPADHAAFEARFLERAIVSRDGRDRVTFQVLANNRITHTYMDDGVEVRRQSRFQYERIARDAGLLRLDYDAGATCELRFHFGSRSSGWYAFACVDGEDRAEIWTGGAWLSLDAEAMPLDLGSGPDDLIYVEGTAIDALTLPAASGGDGEFTYSLSPQVPGLRFDPDTRRLSGTPAEAGNWTMTYRVRDASGDTAWRYFNIAVQAASGGGETIHGVGDTLSDLPSGSWSPDVTSGGSFSSSGGNTTVNLNEGGYIEEGGHRYTCQSSGGCVIENRSVMSGTVVQTASGTAPGGGVSGDHGDDRATATGVEAESDTEGVLETGDVDYFRIVVDAAGTLEAYTSSDLDTRGWLEDTEGAELGTNDDGGAGLNFRISEEISPGTYFVRIEGFSSGITGGYTLHVRFTGSSADTSPRFAAGSGPGDQTFTVGTEIAVLTLPEASGGDGPLTYSLSPEVPGLSFNVTTRRLTGTPTAAGTYDMTYRARDVDADIDRLTFAITVESAGGGGQGTTFGVGDTLPDLPTGTWSASIQGGGALLISGSDVTVRLNDEAYFEYGGHRYTCQSSGDCIIENRSVTSGTIVQTAIGTAPGGGGPSDTEVTASPTNVRYVRDGSTIVVSWDAVQGADYYRIYYDDFHGSSCSIDSSGRASFCDELASRVTGTSYTHDSPDDDWNYYWVVACDSGGCSDIDSANPAEFVDTRPGSPTDVRLVRDGSTIALGWEAVQGADHYKIYYDDFHGSSCSIDSSGRPSFCDELASQVTGTSYTHDSPDDDRNYYWVVACNSGGCSDIDSAIPADVEGSSPDLTVGSTSVSNSNPATGETFTFRATVRNRGDGSSAATILRYYRSTDSTIGTSDTEVGTDPVRALPASRASSESIRLTSPSLAGTYYYGACVDSVADESDTGNNCTPGVGVTATGAPDLITVGSTSVGNSNPAPGESFTFRATVRNRGDGLSAATTLRYYRSTDSTIGASDTEVGTDPVRALLASRISSQSIRLTSPSSAGTYYYGACVDSVAGESDTGNNCTPGLRVPAPYTLSGITCSASNFRPGFFFIPGSVDVRITGTLTAQENLSDVVVSGRAGPFQELVEQVSMGDMLAGESRNFSLSGRVSSYEGTPGCDVFVSYAEDESST